MTITKSKAIFGLRNLKKASQDSAIVLRIYEP